MNPPPTNAPSPRNRGAALLTTLILATVIVVVSISYLALSQREMETTRSSLLAARAELGERAAFEEAASLLRAMTA